MLHSRNTHRDDRIDDDEDNICDSSNDGANDTANSRDNGTLRQALGDFPRTVERYSPLKMEDMD